MTNFKVDIENYINNSMVTIKTDIVNFKTEVENYINNAMATIESDIDKFKLDIKNTMVSFKIEIETLVDSLITTAKTELKSYVDSLIATVKSIADAAIAKATILTDKMKAAANQLNVDVLSLQSASDIMVTTLTNEIKKIQNQFITFGTAIRTSAKGIVDYTNLVKDELIEGKNQIAYPLSFVNTYAKRCRDDAIIFLPYNLFMTIYWGFLKNV